GSEFLRANPRPALPPKPPPTSGPNLQKSWRPSASLRVPRPDKTLRGLGDAKLLPGACGRTRAPTRSGAVHSREVTAGPVLPCRGSPPPLVPPGGTARVQWGDCPARPTPATAHVGSGCG